MLKINTREDESVTTVTVRSGIISQVRLVWSDSEAQRAAKRCRDTKKELTVVQTAALTSSGSERLQSCLRLARYVGLAELPRCKEYVHLRHLFCDATSFFITERWILARKGSCRALMSHCEKTRVRKFKNVLSSHAAAPMRKSFPSFLFSFLSWLTFQQKEPRSVGVNAIPWPSVCVVSILLLLLLLLHHFACYLSYFCSRLRFDAMKQ